MVLIILYSSSDTLLSPSCLKSNHIITDTSWPYFGVKLSCVCPICLLKERQVKKRKRATYSAAIVTYTRVTYMDPMVTYRCRKVTHSDL